MLTADGGSALQGLPRAADDRDAPAIGLEGRSEEPIKPKSLLIQVILLSLCPKASTQNIPEYVAMRDCLRRGAELGWPPAVLLRTWVVLQGIRGKEGVDAAADVMGIGIPSWDSEAYWDTFCDRWEDRYRAAVKNTGRVAVLGHEEGLAVGMTGHHFVAALRSPVQRHLVRELARKCEVYLTQNSDRRKCWRSKI